MRQLLGPQATDSQDRILRELFLQKLPQGMRMVLAAADDMPLDRLATLADRTAEYSAPSIAAVASQEPYEPQPWQATVAEIKASIAELSCAVAAMKASDERPRQSRRGSPHARSSSRRASRSSSRALCWYHRRYAERATHCQQSCSLSENTEARH